MLAVGSHDDHVYVYKISDEGKYHAYHKYHIATSFITALDWSTDSKFIRTNDGAHEQLFYNIDEKIQDTHGSVTSREWATHSVQFGDDRAGIKPKGSEQDKTHIRDVARSTDGALLVTGCEWGLVNVFDYPVS